MSETLLQTTVVGSYPQPDWLIDKGMLRGQYVPRVKAEQLWKVFPVLREEALRDATALAIYDIETAGLDVVTDGEICRESYSNHFATALSGLDGEQPATITNRRGRNVPVLRVVGPIRHQVPVEVNWARFLRSRTRRITKVTLPGPFTLAQQVKDEFYGDPQEVALAFASALNAEARLIQETGIDVIQFDEPWLRNDPKAARAFGVKALNRAVEGLTVRTAVHVCFGYAFLRIGDKPNSYEYLAELAESQIHEISIEAAQPNLNLEVLRELPRKRIALGVLDHATADSESVETVAGRIRAALKFVSPERLMPAPDCGMKYMNRTVAFTRLKNLCLAAAQVRRELAP